MSLNGLDVRILNQLTSQQNIDYLYKTLKEKLSKKEILEFLLEYSASELIQESALYSIANDFWEIIRNCNRLILIILLDKINIRRY